MTKTTYFEHRKNTRIKNLWAQIEENLPETMNEEETGQYNVKLRAKVEGQQ